VRPSTVRASDSNCADAGLADSPNIMGQLLSRIAFSSSLLFLVVGGAAACGDDDASDDDDDGGTEADAGPTPDSGGGQPDAGGGEDGGPDAAPPGAPTIWVHGDLVTDNRNQVAAYAIGSETPAAPAAVLPGGDTARLGLGESPSSVFGTYDVSADGNRIAYPADIEVAGRFDLYVSRVDGSNEIRLVTIGASARFGKARFSRDGQFIAFTADFEADGSFDAYVVPSNEENATPVRVSPEASVGDVDDLVWFADSNTLMFTGDFTEIRVFELWSVDVTAATPTAEPLIPRAAILAAPPAAGVIQPVLGRDGTILVKARIDADRVIRFHTLDDDGQNLDVLPNSVITRTDGTTIAELGQNGLSPDGTQIAFTADETLGVHDVWVMPVDGSAAPTQVTTGLVAPPAGVINPSTGQRLRWSPDGTQIAFIADYVTVNKDEPFVAPVNGDGQVRLANIGPADDAADAISMTWSPDGSQLFVVADHATPNVVELFALAPDLTDQEPTLVFAMPEGGDLRGDVRTSGVSE
jgi:Tol biopolymer transport system component